MFKKAVYAISLLSFPVNAMADYGGMTGSSGMVWGGHMGGAWSVFAGFYALFFLLGVIIFFWLMFRITWALESMAKVKEQGK